jgi:hypothetical protein
MKKFWNIERQRTAAGRPRSARLLLEALEARDVPTAYTVTNLADSGLGSLRQAVANANAHAGGDIIRFASNLHGPLTLTSGQIIISDSLIVAGPGANRLAIDGNGASRIFLLDRGLRVIGGPAKEVGAWNVTISGLTLQDGSVTGDDGGAIRNTDANLTVTGCVFGGNSASSSGGGDDGGPFGGNGGAIAQFSGNLTISGSAFAQNLADASGGAVFYDPSESTFKLTVRRSSFSENVASADESAGSGGGIFASAGGVDIEDSTFCTNHADTAGQGGGVALLSLDATILRSTFNDNTAGSELSLIHILTLPTNREV